VVCQVGVRSGFWDNLLKISWGRQKRKSFKINGVGVVDGVFFHFSVNFGF
jgi:hypothetical protein